MNKLLLIKSLLGISVFVGVSTTGTYFGTKTTVEQYLSSNGQARPSTQQKWEENYKKIKEWRNRPYKTNIKTQNFKNLRKWDDLKNECDKELNKTYKVFWKSWEPEETSKQDLRSYCFSTQ